MNWILSTFPVVGLTLVSFALVVSRLAAGEHGRIIRAYRWAYLSSGIVLISVWIALRDTGNGARPNLPALIVTIAASVWGFLAWLRAPERERQSRGRPQE